MVGAVGHHVLSCHRCTDRQQHHHALNNIVLRALRSAGVPSVLEPPGLSRTDGKRPDGLTLVPWANPRCLVWDAKYGSTFDASHIGCTTRTAGAAAEYQMAAKHLKYSSLGRTFLCLWWWKRRVVGAQKPNNLCGIWAANSAQRLSIAIQRGNAASIMGTFTPETIRGDI
ncbi:unnamed protein product [Chilo suppressalis]|uniref:PD-(D/E)XK endonuclease-like domain-containing protein n=1 Tax=Chilo suppressalis TaxID=168631 RepID=A0ABN8APB3_CHISP|nr:unnamed protein product [Chilo suppressalis]